MASISSLQKRYERSLSRDDYYGAEQACRMLHHRITKPKDPKDADPAKALQILLEGSKTLLSRSQLQAGIALALTAVKHHVDYEVSVTDENITTLSDIAEVIPPFDSSPDVATEALRFLRAAAAWSSRADCHGFKNGSTKLNTHAATAAAAVGDISVALPYFIHSDYPEGLAQFLHKIATEKLTPVNEQPLFLLKAVVQYLLTENIKDAAILQEQFAKKMNWKSAAEQDMEKAQADGMGETPPLANFVELLIKLCQREKAAAPLFQRVIKMYEPLYEKDETFKPAIQKLGQLYFGIQPQQPAGLGGMMSSMLKGLMAGG